MQLEADHDFDLSIGKIGDPRAPKLRRLRAAVRIATWAVGPRTRSVRRSGEHIGSARATVARPALIGQRRVVVKVRYFDHGSGGAPLRVHIAYLAREARVNQRDMTDDQRQERGAGPSHSIDYLACEQPGGQARYAFYDGANTGLDAKALTSVWQDDARHFRMIISAEDGEALGDLKPFIREVMAYLQAKLGTRLDWMAVDHHDTDNPHTHVLIRGRRADGQDLFIPSHLVTRGIREQAQAIVARVLGPRQDIDLARERAREIRLKAVTSLDRELVANVGEARRLQPGRADLAARLERLEVWGLAERTDVGWRIADRLLAQLKALGERAEIERAIGARQIGKPLLEADRETPALGELVHAGPVDDFGERFIAVIETGHGELRYARIGKADDLVRLDGAQPGAIVSLEPNLPSVRPSDEVVARVAVQTSGLYSAERHRALEPGVDGRLVDANIRRLEAMRRLSLVVRRPDGSFEIRPDHLDKAMAYEERIARRFPVSARVASYWSLSEQIEAWGLTHLDRVLAREIGPPEGQGAFARDYASVLEQRRLFLVEQGWMRSDAKILPRSAIVRMARAEVQRLTDDLSSELGLPVLSAPTPKARGVYARRIDLAQGRFALIVGDRAAHLVPWRPVLERFAGREVEGQLRGQTLSWALARNVGPNLPPM